jgi:formimidoylglutamase
MGEIRNPATLSLFFKGRKGDPRLGEWVVPTDNLSPLKRSEKTTVVILGCPDDTGVIANRGRAGAAEGPDSIRKYFYKMTPPVDIEWENSLAVFDLGNVSIHADIRETQRRTQTLVKEIAEAGAIPIVLGGGHDFAAPHFFGFAEAHQKSKKKLGLVNVDPHLDVRPLENGRPHSGTSFRQILEAKIIRGENFLEFGTAVNRNSRDHFNFCEKNGVMIETLGNIRKAAPTATKRYQKHLSNLGKKVDKIATTFDMDACCETEGVSAPPVIGFTAREMVTFAEHAGREKKVLSFEVAETAPGLEPGERSSRIAAEMVYAFLYGRASVISIRNK